jgi:uncharacterized protein DUF3592
MSKTKKQESGAANIFNFISVLRWLKGTLWVFTDTWLIVKSRNWVPTQATIDEVRIETSTGTRGSAEYSPAVKYHFTANGVRYTGDRIEIPPRRSSCESCEENRGAAYQSGRVVGIICDATDPRLSVILRPSMNYWFTIGLGGFSLLLLAGAIRLTIRLLRSLQPT